MVRAWKLWRAFYCQRLRGHARLPYDDGAIKSFIAPTRCSREEQLADSGALLLGGARGLAGCLGILSYLIYPSLFLDDLVL